jgi:hypothetical protein
MHRRLFGKALGAALVVLAVSWFGCERRPIRRASEPDETTAPEKGETAKKAADSTPPADVDPDSLASPKLKGYYDKGYKIGMHFADNLQKEIEGGLAPEDLAKKVKKELAARENAIQVAWQLDGKDSQSLLQAYGWRAGYQEGLARHKISAKGPRQAAPKEAENEKPKAGKEPEKDKPKADKEDE